jgi:hypothetical protein
VRITIEESEHVVPRGARATTWFVRVRDAWVAARKVEGAFVERLDAGPGTVWRQSITLELATGTRLLRVDSGPRAERKTPLEYLESRAVPAARAVIRREFQLSAEGELRALERTRPPAPTRKNFGK